MPNIFQNIEFPKILGILNVTPDSFSDGGRFLSAAKSIEHALEMLEDGADIIDIGGESTRPGAESVTVDEELLRVIPAIEGILKQKPNAIISIDTTKYEVAEAALQAGAKYINDISGLTYEERFLDLALKYDAGLMLMHIKGEPRTMQLNPTYEDVFGEVYSFLKKQASKAKESGVKEVIIDPGIGFGKTLEHNLTLIARSGEMKESGFPVLLGISRKSFLKSLLELENPEERDFPTNTIHTLLLLSNVDYIRVHNVKNIIQTKRIVSALKSVKN